MSFCIQYTSTHSYSGCSAPAVQRRPLPPVPGVPGDSVSTSVPSSPVERQRRPLPAPPVANPGVHINRVGLQTSPLLIQKKRMVVSPPLKPSPYRKNKSEPSPPPSVLPMDQPSVTQRFNRSASLSPQLVLAEDYQEFVSRPESSIDNYEFEPELNSVEDNYSLATSGEQEGGTP